MLVDASTLLTGVNTVSVDTNTAFEMQGFNLDSIMRDTEVMELDLLDNTSGQHLRTAHLPSSGDAVCQHH